MALVSEHDVFGRNPHCIRNLLENLAQVVRLMKMRNVTSSIVFVKTYPDNAERPPGRRLATLGRMVSPLNIDDDFLEMIVFPRPGGECSGGFCRT